MEKTHQKRVMGLDILRFFAVFFVIGVHFMLYSPYYKAPMEGIGMFIMTLLRWLFYTCVPLFLLLTGYLKAKKTLSKEYYKSILPILSSYVIISIAAIFAKKYLFHTGESFASLFLGVFAFTADNYAWYVNMYIGLFLLIPFLNILYKNINTKKNKQILIGTLAFLVSLPPVFNALSIKGNPIHLVPDYWIGLYPFLYYFIGCYIKEYQIEIPKRKNLFYIILVLLVETTLCFILSYGGAFHSALFDGYNALPTVLLATFIFLFFYKVDIKWKPLRLLITDFSKRAFDIYLLSYIVDTFVYKQFASYVSDAPSCLIYIVFFVPGICITCYILALIKKWIIAGIKKIYTFLKKVFYEKKVHTI